MAAEHTDQKFNGSENNSSTAPYLREMIELKDRYYDKLLESYNSHTGPVVKPWTKDKVFEVIEHIKAAKVAMESDHRRNPIRYWHLRYDVIKIAEKDVLIMKKTSPDWPVVQVMPMEDYYEVLLDIHTEFGHCNSAKFQDIIKTKNLIITKKAVDVFVSLCPICDSQLSGNYIKSGCIGIIDMQSVPDGQFKWILYYQDQATKFIHVRPLCSKEGSEVAFELLKIFLDFGMPYILQSDNELDPTKVVEELIKLWPECKKINGVPLPLQTHRSEDSISQEIENLIWAWMRDNITSEWVTGCFFVQYNKNTLFDSKLKRTPFQATFRSEQNCSGISLISQGTNTSIMVTENTGGSRTISTQVSSKAKKRKINPASPIYVSMSPGYSPTTPPHQNQNNAADQSSTTKESPVYAPSSPVYYAPASPRYSPTTPPHLATSPVYTPTSPSYQNQNNEAQSSTTKASPTYVAMSPVYAPTSPTYGATSPVYAPTSPPYQNQNNEAQSSTTKASPTYVATSPVYAPTSPTYGTTSPVYVTTSPSYQNQNNEAQSSTTKASPTYVAMSPVYAPTSPTYGATSPVYATMSPSYQNQNNETQSSTTKASPTYVAMSPVYAPTSPTYGTTSPVYVTTSPSYQNQNNEAQSSTTKASPTYVAMSPVYAPTSPTYGTTSPVYVTTSPSYQNQNNEAQSSTTKASPTYVATSPVYAPTSPTYGTTSPVYATTSPSYQNQNNEAQSSTTKASPTYVATTPVYAVRSPSPTYEAKSPVYVPASLLYTSVSTSCQNQNPYSTRMSSPVYIVPPSPPYQLNKPDPVQQSTQKLETDNAKNEEINQQILQYLKKHLPITAIDQLFRSYAETYKSFPPVIQAELMMEIAKLFSEKQMEVLRNSTNVNNNACTSMDLDSNR